MLKLIILAFVLMLAQHVDKSWIYGVQRWNFSIVGYFFMFGGVIIVVVGHSIIFFSFVIV